MKCYRSAIVVLSLSALRTQTVDLLATAGERRHDVNQDSVHMLGVVALGKVSLAERDGRLTPAMRSLMNAGMQAFQKGDWSRTYRLVTRLHTLLDGKAVTEATEAAAAVDFKLERKTASTSYIR